MASKPITLQIRPRGKPIKSLPESIQLESVNTTRELYQAIADKTKYSPHQLRLTKGSDGTHLPNVPDATVASTGLKEQSMVYVKDLGPQLAWRTVFIIEYLGPIFMHPIMYLLRPRIYTNAPAEPSSAQTLVMLMLTSHFVKRELETLFVHRFSAATMPLRNVFKNSAHYWLLSGVNVAAWIYGPNSSTARFDNERLLTLGTVLFLVGELGNFYTHWVLRGLRSSGGTERNIPQGLLFQVVTCPNYMMEIVSWLGIYVASGFHWSLIVFILVAVLPMGAWAKGKEKRYRREFGDKYKRKRYVMFPGLW